MICHRVGACEQFGIKGELMPTVDCHDIIKWQGTLDYPNYFLPFLMFTYSVNGMLMVVIFLEVLLLSIVDRESKVFCEPSLVEVWADIHNESGSAT